METLTPAPLYSVVIATLGNHGIFWEMLDYLHRTDLTAAEVIVVFNGLSQDRKSVEDVVLSRFPRVRFVYTPEPYGIARANNLGGRAARGRFVAFLHDDVLIYEFRWLAALTEILDRRADVGMVGGSEPKYIDRTPEEAGELEPGLTECDWSPTISVARRGDFAECPFDEFYWVGLEDKDWSLAFRRKGKRVVCRKVEHAHVGAKGSYALFLHNRRLLDYYSKEGVRERYFLTKNKDVLTEPHVRAGWKKWGRWDRDWRKTWWMKLYVHSFFKNLTDVFRRNLVGRSRKGLDGALNALALVLPLSIALSNVMWGLALLLWGVTLVGTRPRYRWTGLEIPWLAFLGVGLATALASTDPLHGLRSFRSEILVVVFFLASQTGDVPALRKRLSFFAVGATVAACVGILQYVIGVEWDPRLAMETGTLPPKLVRLFTLHAGRAQGFYGHPITYAEMLLAAGALILGVWLDTRKRAWALAGVAVGAAILVSQTRSVWLALFLTLGAWIFVRRDKKVLAVTIGGIAAFFLIVSFSPRLRGRAASIVDTTHNSSNLIRMGLWDKSLELIRRHPLAGIGNGNFQVKGSELRWGGAPPDSKWTETHSMYLQVAVGRGALGVGVFLWFLAAIGRRLWHSARAIPATWGIFFGFVGLLMAGVTESWTNDSEVLMCLYFLVGTACAWGTFESKEIGSGRKDSPPLPGK
jgi:putative inorganic carbon (HCO3(-)) transporter